MTPIIGIVSCGLENGRQFVSKPYIEAVESSGGIPVVLPVVSDTSLYPGFASICDGFLFCGGDDITPCLFGAEPLTDRGKTDLNTDTFHLSLMEFLLHSHLPILSICRGMQVLNIALGGTIYQDLSLRSEPSIQHMQLSDNRSDISHKVHLSKNSKLYNILGEYAYTNTFHHQSIHVLGESLKVAGITSDGVIEAVESTENSFIIGVQWHPECLFDCVPSMRNLFSEFVNYSRKAKVLQIV